MITFDPFQQYMGNAGLVFKCTADLSFQITDDDRFFVMVIGLYRMHLQISFTMRPMIAISCIAYIKAVVIIIVVLNCELTKTKVKGKRRASVCIFDKRLINLERIRWWNKSRDCFQKGEVRIMVLVY
jgi:hypothetical protein